MDPRLDRALEEFIETAGQIGAGIGLSRVASQLYALLFISNRPISLDDMVESIGVSKGNISLNIRALEKWGAVRKVWVKGENRKDYYVAEMDTFKIIAEQLKAGLTRRIDDLTAAIKKVEETMRHGSKGLNGEENKRAKEYLERIVRVKDMAGKVKDFLETASRISKIIEK